jgi:hypothetical protein
LDVDGTPGPYWFVVRRTSDLGQLKSQLRKAAALGRHIETRLPEVIQGLEAIEKGQPLGSGGQLGTLLKALEANNDRRMKLGSNLKRMEGTDKDLPKETRSLVEQAASGSIPVGKALLSVLEGSFGVKATRYWSRVLAEAASDVDDLPALVAVLNLGDEVAHSAARKAIRLIDFKDFGPPIESRRSRAA